LRWPDELLRRQDAIAVAVHGLEPAGTTPSYFLGHRAFGWCRDRHTAPGGCCWPAEGKLDVPGYLTRPRRPAFELSGGAGKFAVTQAPVAVGVEEVEEVLSTLANCDPGLRLHALLHQVEVALQFRQAQPAIAVAVREAEQFHQPAQCRVLLQLALRQ